MANSYHHLYSEHDDLWACCVFGDSYRLGKSLVTKLDIYINIGRVASETL